MLKAFAEGWEAMAAVARASHPALYDGGWHPTAVCAPIGAAVAAACLLDLLGGASGDTRWPWRCCAPAGRAGPSAPTARRSRWAWPPRLGCRRRCWRGRAPSWTAAPCGVPWASRPCWARLSWPACSTGAGADGADGAGARAIERNWIKLHPSCLGTHAPIDAAVRAREAGYRRDGGTPVEVSVHPRARQAAHLDEVDDGLAAKFSIPYCVAHALAHGAPRVRDFAAFDAETRERARRVTVVVDESLPEFGAVLSAAGREWARIPCPQGAPERPASPADLAAKVADLAGERLDGVLGDPGAPAALAVDAAGLGAVVSLAGRR